MHPKINQRRHKHINCKNRYTDIYGLIWYIYVATKNLKEEVLLISCISKDITNIQTHLVD